MIEFVSGGRQFGKTVAMIRLAAEHGGYIVVPNHRQARHVADQAEAMGLSIPFPMTWTEFAQGRYSPRGVRNVVIDNLDQCLQSMATVPILGASIPAARQA
ncbi:hypothetical protein [Nocardia sp. NPDC060249]|uniref:hypothetical protein n=1 Tax=Nocardia sp. NPDC060249 TaxID=3347082 RepID=UPI0036614015